MSLRMALARPYVEKLIAVPMEAQGFLVVISPVRLFAPPYRYVTSDRKSNRYLFHVLNSDIEYRQRFVHDEGAPNTDYPPTTE